MSDKSRIEWTDALSKFIRMKIARLMNRNKDVCWGAGCLWALYPEHHEFRELWNYRSEWKLTCTAESEYAFCGKCYTSKKIPLPATGEKGENHG